MVKNRETFYGGCYDLIEVEDKTVTVIGAASSPKDYRIKDELGKTHVCQACNLEEIKQQTEGLKVGDIVTGSQKCQWLDGGYAKIVKIKGECATIEIIKRNDSEQCPEAGEADSGWELKWLVKVEDFKQSEQLKDNIKEDDIVEKDFINGDKVRFIEGLTTLCVSIGDTAVVEDATITHSGKIKVRMDKDNDWWYALPSKLELRVDNPKFEIITSGTTTIVRLEDGREGVAKLYYKDAYSKGFGIIQALGKAMDIDLIGEVQKVVGSYKIEGVDPKLTIVDDAAVKNTFKAGDIVKGISDKYGVTNKEMTTGEVVRVGKNSIDIKVLNRKDKYKIGVTFYDLVPEFFELVETPSVKFKVGCKVKIPTTKLGEAVTPKLSYHIRQANKANQEFLFLVEIIGDKRYVLATTNKEGQGDFFDLEDLELYEETPSLKKPILKEEKVNVIDDFNVGDKVVPHAKTLRGYAENFETEGNWEAAKRKGQPYLYIARFDEEKGEKILVLSDCKTATGGNYFLPTDVTLYVEMKEETFKVEEIKTKELVSFKVGDAVKVREDLISENKYFKNVIFREAMSEYKGKSFKIISVDRHLYRLEGIGWNWTYDMLEKVEEKAEDEVTVTLTEPEFKKGDKVKMISKKPSFGFGGVKTGDIGIIENASKREIIYVTFPNHNYWSARKEDIELVVEDAEVDTEEVVEEFKVGDYIYHGSEGDYGICKIEKIEDNKLWGFFTNPYFINLPTNKSVVEKAPKSSNMSYLTKNSSLKKLVLVDDIIPEIKVGDMVTKEQAIKIIKNGGEIKAYGFIYFEECGILKFKNGERIAENSSGYDINLGGKLEVVSLLKESIGKSQAKRMVKEGKEVLVNNIFKYFLEDGVLMFRSNKTGMLHESLGFKEAFKEGFKYSVS